MTFGCTCKVKKLTCGSLYRYTCVSIRKQMDQLLNLNIVLVGTEVVLVVIVTFAISWPKLESCALQANSVSNSLN
jgi:hypothetical protein